MRSSMYDAGTLLSASKKPYIKELIAKSESMTLEEIQALNEKPDVIRGLLLIKEFGTEKATLGEKVANRMMKHHIPSTDHLQTYCQIYKLNADIWFGDKSTLELKAGWYWAKTVNKVFAGNNYFDVNQNLNELINNSEFVKEGIIGDVYSLENDRRAKLI